MRKVFVERRHADVEAVDVIAGAFLRLAALNEDLRILFERGQRDVDHGVILKQQAAALAVLGEIGNACIHGVARALNVHAVAGDFNLACLGFAQTHERLTQFGAPCTHQARHTQDFARLQGKGDAIDAAGDGEVAHAQDWRFGGDDGLGREGFAQVATDHAPRHLVLVQVCHRVQADHVAVAQHQHAVANLAHLAQLVRNKEDGSALGRKIAHDGKERVDLGARQHGGRFVHDQDARLLADRLGNLHHLLLRYAQVTYQCIRGNVGDKRSKEAAGFLAHALAVKYACTAQLAPQVDIFVCAQRVDQVELLRDHGDPQSLRGNRGCNAHGFFVQENLAARGSIDAADQLHQCGLAGPVFADHAQNLPGADGYAQVFEHFDAGKGFGQTFDA